MIVNAISQDFHLPFQNPNLLVLNEIVLGFCHNSAINHFNLKESFFANLSERAALLLVRF